MAAALLDGMGIDGFVVCPVSAVEPAPAILGDGARQREFADQVGIDCFRIEQRSHRASGFRRTASRSPRDN